MLCPFKSHSGENDISDWRDLVVEGVAEIRATRDADAKKRMELYHFLNHAQSARDGETVERDNDDFKCGYKKRHAFTASVSEGKYIVRAADGTAETFTQRDEAVVLMARLMAEAIVAEKMA